jgi:hypothetical protein
VIWLILRQPKTALNPSVSPPQPIQATNAQPPLQPSSASPPTVSINAFLRPDSIDEETWNRLMQARQMMLEQNQPVEFYARVVDQNEQPIEGARLKLKLTRTNEKMFETTNFFHMQMGDEVLIIPLELTSDANGWIQVTRTNGSFLAVWGLTKEGYLSSYPDGNFGGVHYELHGVRNPASDILMTNAWDSKKGYIFHLQRIEGK